METNTLKALRSANVYLIYAANKILLHRVIAPVVCQTYLLTLWSTVLLEKLTVNFAASQEIPRIYGTRKFLTVPTRARHLSLS
jgi:hypothetical protein